MIWRGATTKMLMSLSQDERSRDDRPCLKRSLEYSVTLHDFDGFSQFSGVRMLWTVYRSTRARVVVLEVGSVCTRAALDRDAATSTFICSATECEVALILFVSSNEGSAALTLMVLSVKSCFFSLIARLSSTNFRQQPAITSKRRTGTVSLNIMVFHADWNKRLQSKTYVI